jgi:hypothetical protein
MRTLPIKSEPPATPEGKMRMRSLAVVAFALCAGGCTSVDVETIAPGAYTLTVPTDTFSSRHAMELYAAEEAGDVCPQGWVKLAVKDRPSDVAWTIQCTGVAIVPEAELSSQPEVPTTDTTVVPLASVHPLPSGPDVPAAPPPPPGAASAPPEDLAPSQTPPSKSDDDAVPPEKL